MAVVVVVSDVLSAFPLCECGGREQPEIRQFGNGKFGLRKGEKVQKGRGFMLGLVMGRAVQSSTRYLSLPGCFPMADKQAVGKY